MPDHRYLPLVWFAIIYLNYVQGQKENKTEISWFIFKYFPTYLNVLPIFKYFETIDTDTFIKERLTCVSDDTKFLQREEKLTHKLIRQSFEQTGFVIQW